MQLYANSAAYSADVVFADGRAGSIWLKQNEAWYDDAGYLRVISFRHDDGSVSNLLLQHRGADRYRLVEIVKQVLIPVGLEIAGGKIKEKYRDDPHAPAVNLAVAAAEEWGPEILGRIVDAVKERFDPESWCYYSLAAGELVLAAPLRIPEPPEVAALRDAVLRARLDGDPRAEGGALSDLGVALWRAGRAQEAAGVLRSAVDLLRSSGEEAAEGFAATALGVVFAQLRQYDDALEAYNEALAVVRRRGDEVAEAQVLSNLSNALRELGYFGDAANAARRAAEVYQRGENRHHLGLALLNLGLALNGDGQFEQSIDASQQAILILNEMGDTANEGSAANNAGTSCREVGRLEDAVRAHRYALEIAEAIGDHDLAAMAWAEYGSDLAASRDYASAIEAFEKSLAVHRHLGDRFGEGKTLTSLGNVLNGADQPERAARVLESAIAVARASGDRSCEAMALHNLGSHISSPAGPTKPWTCTSRPPRSSVTAATRPARRPRCAGWRWPADVCEPSVIDVASHRSASDCADERFGLRPLERRPHQTRSPTSCIQDSRTVRLRGSIRVERVLPPGSMNVVSM